MKDKDRDVTKEEKENFMVTKADASCKPRTVVIHAKNTTTTRRAVVCTVRFQAKHLPQKRSKPLSLLCNLEHGVEVSGKKEELNLRWMKKEVVEEVKREMKRVDC